MSIPTDQRGVRKSASLLVLAAVLLGAAPVATVDGELGMTCMKAHQPIVNGDAIAVSVKDGATTWGACLTYIKRDRAKTWWAKRGKTWTVLGAPTKANATLTMPPSKLYGIPARDVKTLTTELTKANATVKHDPNA